EYSWEKKSPAFNLFSAITFGFTADELFAWVKYGGGQELWDELSGQVNIKSLLCTNSGCQMGGLFTREVTSVGGCRGLRYRMPATGRSLKPWPRANTRAPWQSSTRTTPCRCASCATRERSKSLSLMIPC